jgi:L-ribulose-5-phosphate 4-epimerase
MLEDVARTVHIARQGGEPVPIAPDAIDHLYQRYQHVYGQTTDDRRAEPAQEQAE